MNRRDFLMTSAAMAALPKAGLATGAQTILTAEALTQQILPEDYAGPTRVLGFNGGVPGPELRVRQGGTLNLRLQNNLDQGATVHWHGIRLNNAMDGVPMMTQDLVPPGDSFDYSFVAKDAGTYWYHSHYLSHEQVARGLMGPLIIEESIPPDVDHDLFAVLADWRLAEDGQLTEDFGNRHDIAHAGRMGNYAKVFLPDVTLQVGERVRLRLINAAVDRVFPVILKGLQGKIVALDGMPIAAPRDYDLPVLAPAQRVDIIADVTGPVELEMDHRMGAYPLGGLPVSGSVTPRSAAIQALPANDLPIPEEVSQDLTMTMMGGAMGGAHGGDNIWALNDISDMQPEPFARFERGETARIRLVNGTRWPHGIHLHGHHFYELAVDGSLGDFRDTSLVNPGQTQDILCVFDNPGRWMMHCHMLSHHVGGMTTWVEVA
ncbi:MAG: multicopper oxidase family protein [Paracoccaceae bacterium]|nr:multicopper oxidase family protein [Paracoccaceae bacterium]